VRLARSQRFWHSEVHDGYYGHGAVTGAAVSRDDRYLLSAARDGSFFVQLLGPGLSGQPEVDADAAAEAAAAADAADKTPMAAADDAAAAPDITAPTHYSIEEAKQKTEEDNLRAAAEEKKLGRCLHSSVFRLKGSAFCAIGVHRGGV